MSPTLGGMKNFFLSLSLAGARQLPRQRELCEVNAKIKIYIQPNGERHLPLGGEGAERSEADEVKKAINLMMLAAGAWPL